MKTSGMVEIASFTREIMDFDLGDVSVEQLEQRLELAVAQIMAPLSWDCTCDGQYCQFSCNSNCPANCTSACGQNRPPLLD